MRKIYTILLIVFLSCASYQQPNVYTKEIRYNTVNMVFPNLDLYEIPNDETIIAAVDHRRSTIVYIVKFGSRYPYKIFVLDQDSRQNILKKEHSHLTLYNNKKFKNTSIAVDRENLLVLLVEFSYYEPDTYEITVLDKARNSDFIKNYKYPELMVVNI